MQIIKNHLYIILIMMLSTLTGCGFHLRGSIALPPSFQSVYIQTSDTYGDLALQLRDTINESGAKTMPTADNAQINVVILNENTSQVVTSIATNSQITVILVTYSVKFQVTDAYNHVLLGPRTVSTSRTYSQNSNVLLSVTNDLNLLEHNMRIDVAQQILAQMTSRDGLVALDVSDTTQ